MKKIALLLLVAAAVVGCAKENVERESNHEVQRIE